MVLRWKCTGVIGFVLAALLAAASARAEPGTTAADAPPESVEQAATTLMPAAVPISSEPTAEVQTRYREVVTHAIAEFDAGRFAEARALFLEAHALWPSARTLRTLGMTAFELRMYPRALVELLAALSDSRRPLDADQQRQVSALVEQTRSFVGRYRVHLSPQSAELIVDGAPFEIAAGELLILAVGDHELRARAKGHGELRRPLQVQGREDEQLSFTLEALGPLETPKPSPAEDATRAAAPSAHATSSTIPLQRKLAWTAFSVGAAGVVLTAVMGGLALERKKVVEDDSNCPAEQCPPPYHHDRDQLIRFANTATAGAVIAGLGLASGLVLWLTARPEKRPSARARAAVRLALAPGGVTGTF